MASILVIKPSSLGDIIHTAPAVGLLSKVLPRPRIAWIVNEEYADFVRELPGVTEVIPFPRASFRLSRFPLWLPAFLRWLRQLPGDFDVAVDFQGLQRSGLMARASGAVDRFGFRGARELAWIHYSRRVELGDEVVHAAERNLTLAREVSHFLLGRGTSRDLEAPGPQEWHLTVPPVHAAFADGALGRGAAGSPPIVALCPGARWASKRWPAARWAALLESLSSGEPPLRPILLGGQDAKDAAEEILECLGGRDAVETWIGKATIWQSAALLARCAAAVSVDSAPLHLAAALGLRTVGLFGPTDPGRVAPRGSRHRALRDRSLPCLGCSRCRCPLPERRCLEAIGVEPVAAAVLEAVAEGGSELAE